MIIKILNLYAGIGGNRKLWGGVGNIKVTAVELNPEIAKIYQDFFPQDKVIVADAHQYLLEHFKEFDFIWSSPPCPTHSKLALCYGNNINCTKLRFPDMKLYEEIILLQYFFKGKYVVENTFSYYEPLIKPTIYRQHYYWSNFIIQGEKNDFRGHNLGIEGLQKLKDIDISSYKISDKEKILRNCVEPEAALFIFNSAFKEIQITLSDYNG